MIRHNLAARSLRHLRFARRMMAGQPLLARAAVSLDGKHPGHLSASVSPVALVSLGGYQLPVGRVLRRLPQSDTGWMDGVARSDEPASDASTPSVALPTETLLRLLPPLNELDASSAEVEPGPAIASVARVPADHAVQSSPRRSVASAPPISSPPPATDDMSQSSALARTAGPRPRSRIVELPGVISLPLDDETDGEGTPPVISAEHEPTMTAHSVDVSDAERSGPVPNRPLTPPVPVPEAGERPVAPDVVNVANVANVEATPAPETSTPPASAPRRRGGKRSDERHPRASDALFPPTDGDRSPQTWLARLQQAGKPAPTAPAAPTPPDDEPPSPTRQRSSERGTRKSSPAARHAGAHATSAPVERPAPLPDSSRALLREMTGIDPVDVPVFRGPAAERMTAAQNADALTDGSAIALGAGYATDTPETLGLVAHELTHVAHRRTSRFVPPVAAAQAGQRRSPSVPPAASSPAPQPATSSADEEAQAAQVEARVTRIAHARKATPPEPLQPPQQLEKPVSPAAPARQWQAPPDARPVWGNLPAPWEPLPDWMASPASAPASAAQPTGQHVPTPVAQPAQVPTSAPARVASPDAAGIQRAERGRSLPASENESPPAQPAQPAHEGGAPEPDLDALAQQVHAILKRRLAAERRRFG